MKARLAARNPICNPRGTHQAGCGTHSLASVSRGGVSERIASFVMPLGTSINHAGSALYECAGAMFIAQAYGLDLPFGQQFTVVTLALLTSMGAAGIPAASLVAIAVILSAVGLPPEGIGALPGLDRLLDMARTAINVFADAVCTVIVARLEGEKNLLLVMIYTCEEHEAGGLNIRIISARRATKSELLRYETGKYFIREPDTILEDSTVSSTAKSYG
jgi:hypothetical protein